MNISDLSKDVSELISNPENVNLKDRLRDFLANSILLIETPLIKDDEIDEAEDYIISTYKYNDDINAGGLACSHFWNSISISFHSSDEWNKPCIKIKKNDS